MSRKLKDDLRVGIMITMSLLFAEAFSEFIGIYFKILNISEGYNLFFGKIGGILILGLLLYFIDKKK